MKITPNFPLSLLGKFVCLLLLQAWLCHSLGYAQSTTSNAANAGKEFYITYLNRSATLQLKVVVEKACYITAKYNNQTSLYWYNWNNTLVQPGIYTATVTNAEVINATSAGTGGISLKTITLTSTEDICVYAINYQTATSDATCLLPAPTWGAEYRLATGHPSQNTCYALVAKENNTAVTLHNGATITLSQNEAYHYTALSGVDMTGEKITSTKPIGLFSGAISTLGPGQSNAFGCTSADFGGGTNASADHTYEQLWSVDKWGKDFFAFPIRTPGGIGNWGGMLALVADENGTNVTVSGDIVGGPFNYAMNAGDRQYICTYMTGLTRIVSDKPIMAFLVLPDACVMYIPPTDQRILHAFVAPFILSGATNINQHGIDLLIPAAYWAQTVIQHDGIVVSNSLYTVNASAHFPDWYHVRRDLTNVDIAIDISCPGGFLAYISGNGQAETYAFSSGAGAYDLQNYFTIQEKGTTVDTYYENTTEVTHTFETADNILLKRTIEAAFTQVQWLVDGVAYPVVENTNTLNTVSIPASAFGGACGSHSISMSVRYSGATADSVYMGLVWLNDPPAISVVASASTVCSGSPVTFTATVSSGSTPAMTYTWDIGGTAATTTSNTYTTILSTTSTYSVSVKNANGCTSSYTAPQTVAVSPGVTPTISISASDNNICSGTSVTYTSNITNGGSSPSYQWQINGLSPPSGGTGSSYSYVPDNGDKITCELTSSDSSVCSGAVTSNELTMTVTPTLTPSATIIGVPD